MLAPAAPAPEQVAEALQNDAAAYTEEVQAKAVEIQEEAAAFVEDPTPVAPTPVAPAPAPQQGYAQPQQGYAQPQQGYAQPQQGYAQPQQGYQQAYTPYQETAQPAGGSYGKCKTFGIISFVLGICSIVFCWLGVLPIAGIILGFFMVAFGVVGLIFAGISQKNGYFKLAKLGKIFSIIGLCLSAILWIVGIVITASGNFYYY